MLIAQLEGMPRIWLASLVVDLVLAAAAAAQPAPCAMTELPGLSRQFAATKQIDGTIAAGTATDFDRVARAVLGGTTDAAVDWPTRQDLPCSADVRARDRQASKMAMAGYSAKEIADVLEGHLTVTDLNQARARLMAGQPRAVVADFLDARWRMPAAINESPALAAFLRDTPRLDVDLELELSILARTHDVPAGLVRAMVAAESGGNERAVSTAGAIGLMQLMPRTAAALGVNPWQPRENLRGGITYMASLLRAYDENPRLALIAYNAGPQHANRVRVGSAVAYRETRKYLSAIEAMYPLP